MLTKIDYKVNIQKIISDDLCQLKNWSGWMIYFKIHPMLEASIAISILRNNRVYTLVNQALKCLMD